MTATDIDPQVAYRITLEATFRLVATGDIPAATRLLGRALGWPDPMIETKIDEARDAQRGER